MIITMFYISSIVTTKKMLIEYTQKKMRKKSSMSLKMKDGKRARKLTVCWWIEANLFGVEHAVVYESKYKLTY